LLSESDLHVQIRSQDPKRLVIFLIDTSDSMGDGPTARISAALGASMTLAARSYLSRDQVCLITFRDRDAQLVVPPTNSVSRLKQQLKKLPVGGATPLSAGLQKAQTVINQVQAKSPLTTPLLVLLSDGEATSPITAGKDPQTEALEVARQLANIKIPALVIDTVIENRRQAFMPQLAEALETECHHIHDLQAGSILNLIDEAGMKQT
jgi:magnesium chelatase subunit D